LAAEERSLDKLASDFVALKGLLAASPELVQLVRSPIISREQQAAGIDAVLKQAGAIELTRKLAQLLTRKRRLFILGDVIASFENLVARHRGEIAAEVTAARELSEPETTELKRILKERFGREPRLTMHVDPALLGGIVLRVGSRMIDSSLRSKLEALRVRMRG
jgi:F-type H+-transporting ATPase subunit delta